ncbi:MAG: precorrin-6A/cobalt-precorrin-6A reductase [Crocinitomicaceae bacterium]|nr:precorrin-6A/cobalt-precorrin-6A reductase [Crocinitomicaceae bacterium]
MILVFGGTTEGRHVVSLLNEMQIPFVYSTKAKIDVELGKFGMYRHGVFTKKALVNFIQEENISLIINASHPFAKELHQTIDEVSQLENTKVLRLERIYSERVVNDWVKYVDDYHEVIDILLEGFQDQNLLALTGVQSIEKFKEFWKDNTCYFRILDRVSSIQIARKSGFPKTQLILEQPENLIGGEEQLIDQLNIDVIVTKESGGTGALDEKIRIAISKRTPLFILKKPTTPRSFIQVQSINELKKILSDTSSSFLTINNFLL